MHANHYTDHFYCCESFLRSHQQSSITLRFYNTKTAYKYLQTEEQRYNFF